MIRLRIKNFGPIHEGLTEDDGWIQFRGVTVFIGNQGSGKSTVAKLFSTFTWMEKVLVRGDYDSKYFERKGRFQKLLAYHRLDRYEWEDQTSEIEYRGRAFEFSYKSGLLTVTPLQWPMYQLPQVMYVPAERNFIAYVKHPRELKLSSEALKEFLTVFEEAKAKMTSTVQLPIKGSELEYDKLNDILNLKGPGHKVGLTDASSGFQSLVPLYLTSHHLAQSVQSRRESVQPMSSEEQARFKRGVESIFGNDHLTEEQQRLALSTLSARFNKTAFLNIVEEPEQNLFPSSQWEMLTSLLGFKAQGEHNRLVLTTHSPYIGSYLSLSVEAFLLHRKMMEYGRTDLVEKLNEIVPAHARIAPGDVAIYESTDEPLGAIRKLRTLGDGMPSDDNLLNQFLRRGNTLFDDLLALEEELTELRFD